MDDRTDFIKSPRVSERIINNGTPITGKSIHRPSNNPNKSHHRHSSSTGRSSPPYKNSPPSKNPPTHPQKRPVGSFSRVSSLLSNAPPSSHPPTHPASLTNKIYHYGLTRITSPDVDINPNSTVLQPPTCLVKKFEEFFSQTLSHILFTHTRFAKFLLYIRDSTIRDIMPETISNLATNTLLFLHNLLYKEENLHRYLSTWVEGDRTLGVVAEREGINGKDFLGESFASFFRVEFWGRVFG